MERVKADGIACVTCAAKTLTAEGSICEPWKLGQSNKKGKNGRFVMGRNHTKGTTMRPKLCPHPESIASTGPSAQVLLRKILNR